MLQRVRSGDVATMFDELPKRCQPVVENAKGDQNRYSRACLVQLSYGRPCVHWAGWMRSGTWRIGHYMRVYVRL